MVVGLQRILAEGRRLQLETQVLIIGAGATGTGLARDLALRGVHCIIAEQADVNAGASGSNHGLLHSGARYVSGDPETAKEYLDRLMEELPNDDMIREAKALKRKLR